MDLLIIPSERKRGGRKDRGRGRRKTQGKQNRRGGEGRREGRQESRPGRKAGRKERRSKTERGGDRIKPGNAKPPMPSQCSPTLVFCPCCPSHSPERFHFFIKKQRPKTKDRRPKSKDQRPKGKGQRPKTEDKEQRPKSKDQQPKQSLVGETQLSIETRKT